MAAEGFSAICDLLKRCWDSTYFVNCRILKNNDEQGICDHPNSFPDSVIGSRNFFSANLTHAITGMWQTGPRNLATFESGLRQKLELAYVRSASVKLDLSIVGKTVKAMVERTGR